MDDTRYTIVQKRFLKGRQTLTLDGAMLKAECRRGLSLREYRIDLHGFLPDPMRVKTVPLARIVVASLFVLVSMSFIIAGVLSSNDEKMFGWITAGFFALLLAILVGSSIPKMMVNVVLFQGPGGQAALWPDRPDRAHFDQFVAQMSARIREVGNREEHLLKRLRLAEIINDWQYDQAMDLLQRQEDRPDGP